ncbi:MAG: hypothetical protein LBI81_01305 [Puniceicoccales bacterium]|jgi:hypothetical protein|nr:hypothetical protein [Puniceicoccales bacterium]
MHNGAKIIVCLAASVTVSILSYAGYRLAAQIKKRKDSEKFSNPRYSIGAAIINMERAVVYGDDENFKFFARYAIRMSLGMPKSYPPNEPSLEEIMLEFAKNHSDEDLSEKIRDIYGLEFLAEDTEKWNAILRDMRQIIPAILENRTRQKT